MGIPGEVWVVIEGEKEAAGLGTAARRVTSDVVSLVVGSRSSAERLAGSGGSTTRWLGELAPSARFEDFSAPIAEMAEKERPVAILIASSASGRLMAGRLAARLGTAAVTDVSDLDVDEPTGRIVAKHPVYAGGAQRTEELRAETGILTLNPGAFPPVEEGEGDETGLVVEYLCAPVEPRVTVVDRRPVQSSSVELASAKVVVGAGRGLGQRDRLALVQELARALGGEIACTRPLAEGVDWMDHDRYLGVSGLDIAPELYVAVGISGQMQHMVGVERARVIVAINNDPTAPVFQQSDYAIVGDLAEVVPALTAAVRSLK